MQKEYGPVGLNENKVIARKGGHVAKVAREDIEKTLNKNIIIRKNNNNL